MSKISAALLAGLAGVLIGGAAIWFVVKPTRATTTSVQPAALAESIPLIASAKSDGPSLDQTVPISSSNATPANPAVQESASSASVPATETALNPTAPAATPSPSPFPSTKTNSTNGSIDDALSFALEASEPYVKEGFTVREDYWGGDLGVKQQKAIVHQLFKGNEYWFWMGTDVDNAKISVHVYDAQGNLAEASYSQKQHMAAARVVPKTTGSYYLIVEVVQSDHERTHWALAYGFK